MPQINDNHKSAKEVEHNHELLLDLVRRVSKQRDSAFKKFPLLFTLLGTFGVICTYYGFQHILEKIPLLANDPIVALIFGLLVLVLTGKLYKKLG